MLEVASDHYYGRPVAYWHPSYDKISWPVHELVELVLVDGVYCHPKYVNVPHKDVTPLAVDRCDIKYTTGWLIIDRDVRKAYRAKLRAMKPCPYPRCSSALKEHLRSLKEQPPDQFPDYNGLYIPKVQKDFTMADMEHFWNENKSFYDHCKSFLRAMLAI